MNNFNHTDPVKFTGLMRYYYQLTVYKQYSVIEVVSMVIIISLYINGYWVWGCCTLIIGAGLDCICSHICELYLNMKGIDHD